MVRFLLDAGADQEHKTDEMHTALMEACMVILNCTHMRFCGKKGSYVFQPLRIICILLEKSLLWDGKDLENFVRYQGGKGEFTMFCLSFDSKSVNVRNHTKGRLGYVIFNTLMYFYFLPNSFIMVKYTYHKIYHVNHFWELLSICIMLCNHRYHPFSELFSSL